MDRRIFLTSAAAGATLVALEAATISSASAATAPKLPYEVSRIANVRSAAGKLYDNIEVDIAGDRARIFLPQTITRGQTKPVGAVWFGHGGGSSHNALNGGFKYPGELVADNGAIGICINAGGTQYTNEYAVKCQKNAWTYLNSLFPVRMNFLRPTSAGGALAIGTYGMKTIPYIRGLYMVNGLYDLEWLAVKDVNNQSSLLAAFGNDRVKLRAANPARIPASYFAGANVKVVVSDSAHPDTTVDPEANGLAFTRKIASTAAEATVGYHTLGHDTPSWTNQDMLKTFAKWSGL